MNHAEVQIRPMRDDEISTWGPLRSALWTDCLAEDNAEDAAKYLAGGDLKIVFFAIKHNQAIGFAEISERSVVDSCEGGPAAYLEGWYVDANHRRKGIGKALIEAAVAWAREHSYLYLGSDVELENRVSQKAHVSLGFEETGRVVTYRRSVC